MLERCANFLRYFGDKDIEGMFATLGPLHDLLAKVSCFPILLNHVSLTRNREQKHSERYLLLNLLGGICKKLSIGATFIDRPARMVT